MIAIPFTPADTRRDSTWRLWVCAGLAAAALHVGGLALALTRAHESSDDALGAQAIEIGLDFEAPKASETDLPPGPEADAAAAAPEVVEQKTKTEEADLPKEQPTEADAADRAVSPTAQKKPDDTLDVAAVQAAPSTTSVASEAAAPAPSDAAQAGPKSVTPALGIGDSARRVIQSWQRELVTHLDRHKRYPAGAARRDATIMVAFTLDRLGHVKASRVLKGSGDDAFDEAALAMLRRSDPVPAPPPLVADQGLDFTVPVVFRTKGRS